MQIYNEQVQDLLKEDNSSFVSNQENSGENNIKLKSLNVRQDANGKVNIPQLTKTQIMSI